MRIHVITIDIQSEENPWIESDDLIYINNMEYNENKVLLSWIYYTKYDLSYNLLTSFKVK